MASLSDRLGRLAARRAPPPWKTPPLVTLLIKEMNAERMELDGRPPDPANEPTPEEEEAGREASKSFLETGGPRLRATTTDPAALENIRQMEEQAKQHLSEGSSV
jgi:hypothetical protein